MSMAVSEQSILDAFRQVPEERWGEVLRFLDSLSEAAPAICTGTDLTKSGCVGLWSDRDDLGTSQEFARRLRQQAEARRGAADAAGH